MENILSTNICLYHGVDLDGFCSGAIYSKYMRERGLPYELIPANYGWKLPWEKFDDVDVTMVDFSLPMNELQKLLNIAKSVMWIDHHKSAIEEFRELYEQLSLMFGNRSSTPYIPLPNSQPHIPNPWESPVYCGSITSDPPPPQPDVYCASKTGESTNDAHS